MKGIKRKNLIGSTAALILSAMLTLFSSPLSAAAVDGICTARAVAKTGAIYTDSLGVIIDGEKYGGEIFLIANTAYVSLREFSEYAEDAAVTWDADTSTAYVTAEALELSVTADSYCIEANGRALWCEYGCFVKDGRMTVPLRQLSRALGYECEYDGVADTVFLTRKKAAIESGDDFYDNEELHWLSRIIFAEAGAEPFYGKLAVGSVIMNRVSSDEFPSTLTGVIFDTENGVQFSPVTNGTIYSMPDSDSVLAAKLTLEGVSVTDCALYFLNAELAESFWIVNNCTYVMTVGSHDFYA